MKAAFNDDSHLLLGVTDSQQLDCWNHELVFVFGMGSCVSWQSACGGSSASSEEIILWRIHDDPIWLPSGTGTALSPATCLLNKFQMPISENTTTMTL
jgi:hypothetical protein